MEVKLIFNRQILTVSMLALPRFTPLMADKLDRNFSMSGEV